MSTGGPAQTVTQMPPEFQLPYMSDVYRMGQQVAYTPYTAYQGPRFAETAPLYQQGVEQAQQTAAMPGLLGTMNVGGQNMGVMQAYMNPYQQAVTDVAKQAAVREYNTGLQNLRSQAGQRGAFGGSRQAIMESELARGLGSQLGNIAAFDKAGQLYSADVARQQQAAQQAMATGLAEQAQRQAQLDALYGEYERQRTYPQQQAEAYRNIIFGQQMPVTSSQYQAPANPLSQIVGIGSLLYGGMK